MKTPCLLAVTCPNNCLAQKKKKCSHQVSHGGEQHSQQTRVVIRASCGGGDRWLTAGGFFAGTGGFGADGSFACELAGDRWFTAGGFFAGSGGHRWFTAGGVFAGSGDFGSDVIFADTTYWVDGGDGPEEGNRAHRAIHADAGDGGEGADGAVFARGRVFAFICIV